MAVYTMLCSSVCRPGNGLRAFVPPASEQAAGRIRAKCLTLVLGLATLLSCLPLPAMQAQPAAPQSSSQPASQPSESLPVGLATRGKELFAGQIRLKNGGPSCTACHSVAGVSFPNGGTLGPNLTGVYNKLGPQGIQVAMKTLYFRVMTSVYEPHPLTLQEQADLVAFFQEAATQPEQRWNTQIIALLGVAGFLILLLITHFLWRDRLKSVRRTMVERAMRQGGFHS